MIVIVLLWKAMDVCRFDVFIGFCALLFAVPDGCTRSGGLLCSTCFCSGLLLFPLQIVSCEVAKDLFFGVGSRLDAGEARVNQLGCSFVCLISLILSPTKNSKCSPPLSGTLSTGFYV
jgi:hypothetical protein